MLRRRGRAGVGAVGLEVAGLGAEPAEDVDEGVHVRRTEAGTAEDLGVERLRGGDGDAPALVREGEHERAAVRLVGVRSTSPAASSRSTALVTEVGWTCRSADALDIRIRFSREKFSSASSSYRAKVSP